MATKRDKDETIVVTEVQEGRVDAVIVGRSPLLLHRMSEKAKRELRLPAGRKTSADKAANMKHNPLEEFRASAHQLPDGPTLLGFPSAGVKRAIASAALDMPGSVSKAKIGRLVWVPGEQLPVYGSPQVFMTVVRMADINRTPDVRTLAIVPRWAIPVSIEFVQPLLNPTTILNLLIAAGMYIGIGDGRNEKGKLSYGQFRVISTAQSQTDEDVQQILSENRESQIAAMEHPSPYSEETSELMRWFDTEVKVRGKKLVAA